MFNFCKKLLFFMNFFTPVFVHEEVEIIVAHAEKVAQGQCRIIVEANEGKCLGPHPLEGAPPTPHDPAQPRVQEG
jgi:hypothetical protein